MYKKNRAIQC